MMARLEGLEPPAHGLEGRCSIQLSYRRMPRAASPSSLAHTVETSVSADRYVLYHAEKRVSTDFSMFRIDKKTGKVYSFPVRGEQTVAGLRACGKSGHHRARVPVNGRWRRLQGKCNRNKPPSFRTVRMERRGKSSPADLVTVPRCKPHPVQDAMEALRRPAAPSAIA